MLVFPGDPRYEAHRPRDSTLGQLPAAIALPGDVAEAAAAVEYARMLGLRVVVQAPDAATTRGPLDGVLLLDLSGLSVVERLRAIREVRADGV